jgi:NAD(P)-dependent dehydrogenase (short-subunit alcohol dehydrogenase family)
MPERVAVLTGASSGFGLLTSVELAKAGFRVIASMRDPAKRERLVQAAAAAQVSDRIDVRALDVTQVDAIPEFVDSVIRDYGRIDVLVNNAGFAVGGLRRRYPARGIAPAVRNELLRSGRDDQGRAARDATAKVGSHYPGLIDIRTARCHLGEQLQRLEACAGGLERVAATRSEFPGDQGRAGRTRGLRYGRLDQRRGHGTRSKKENLAPTFSAACACAR